MKKIYSNIIPPAGYKAITIWPFLFIRKKAAARFNDVDERHEYIHGEQQKEMLIVFFYLWYGIEWLIRCIQYGNAKTAYKNICFEREAYANETDVIYLDTRKHYAWFKYLRKLN